MFDARKALDDLHAGKLEEVTARGAKRGMSASFRAGHKPGWSDEARKAAALARAKNASSHPSADAAKEADRAKRESAGIASNFDRFYNPDPEKEYKARTLAARQYAATPKSERSGGSDHTVRFVSPTAMQVPKLANVGGLTEDEVNLNRAKLSRLDAAGARGLSDKELANTFLGWIFYMDPKSPFAVNMKAEVKRRQDAGSTNAILKSITAPELSNDTHDITEGWNLALEEVFGRGRVKFDPDQHGRDRLGQFTTMLGALKDGEHAKLPVAGIRVEKKGDKFQVVSSGGGRTDPLDAKSAANDALTRFDMHRPARKPDASGKRTPEQDIIDRAKTLAAKGGGKAAKPGSPEADIIDRGKAESSMDRFKADQAAAAAKLKVGDTFKLKSDAGYSEATYTLKGTKPDSQGRLEAHKNAAAGPGNKAMIFPHDVIPADAGPYPKYKPQSGLDAEAEAMAGQPHIDRPDGTKHGMGQGRSAEDRWKEKFRKRRIERDTNPNPSANKSSVSAGDLKPGHIITHPVTGDRKIVKKAKGLDTWNSSGSARRVHVDFTDGDGMEVPAGKKLDFRGMKNLSEAVGHESLDRSPKKNWVERAGQLPAAIQHMAKDIHEERGMPLDQAIPIAISQAKKLAAKGNAKYVAAVAEWEALKAKNKAKGAGKSLTEALIDSAVFDAWDRAADALPDRVIEEAVLPRGSMSRGKAELKRLPDGSFAPKGLGSVLTPGQKITVPHEAGPGEGRVVGVSGGKAMVTLHSGPEAGKTITVGAGGTVGDRVKRALGMRPVDAAHGDAVRHYAEQAHKLKPGQTMQVPTPDGPINITRTPQKVRGAAFHVGGGGHNANPDLRRGPRFANRGDIGHEVAERVRDSHHADNMHTADLAVKAAHLKPGAEMTIASVDGHHATVKKTKDNRLVVTHDGASTTHPNPAAAIGHAKKVLRKKGAKFLPEGLDSDPLSTLTSKATVKRAVDQEKRSKVKEFVHGADHFQPDHHSAAADLVPEWMLHAMQGSGLAGRTPGMSEVTVHMPHLQGKGHGAAGHAAAAMASEHAPGFANAVAKHAEVIHHGLHMLQSRLVDEADALRLAEQSGDDGRAIDARRRLAASLEEVHARVEQVGDAARRGADAYADVVLLGEAAERGQKEAKVAPGEDPRSVKTDGGQLPGDTTDHGQQLVSEGPRVMHLQRRLDSLGHDVLDDGKFGPKTRDAVKVFQRSAMLKDDGVVGPLTTSALKAAPGPQDMRAATAHPDAPVDTGDPAGAPQQAVDVDGDGVVDTAQAGGGDAAPLPAQGEPTKPKKPRKPAAVLHKGKGVGDVRSDGGTRALQGKLGLVGQTVTVDGRFGPKTQTAVKRFQRRMGLNPDGIVGPKTHRALKREAKGKLNESLFHRGRSSDVDFDPGQHRRNRAGEFAKMVGKLKPGEISILPGEAYVARHDNDFNVVSGPGGNARIERVNTADEAAQLAMENWQSSQIPSQDARTAAKVLDPIDKRVLDTPAAPSPPPSGQDDTSPEWELRMADMLKANRFDGTWTGPKDVDWAVAKMGVVDRTADIGYGYKITRADSGHLAVLDGSDPLAVFPHTPEGLRAAATLAVGRRDRARRGMSEGVFDRLRHPRDETGRFKAKLAKLDVGASIDVEPGYRVTKDAAPIGKKDDLSQARFRIETAFPFVDDVRDPAFSKQRDGAYLATGLKADAVAAKVARRAKIKVREAQTVADTPDLSVPCKTCRKKGACRHRKLREAKRGESAKVKQELKRLPDGSFAPKGQGQVLKAGDRVSVPHKSGSGFVDGIATGPKDVMLLSGPDAGQNISMPNAGVGDAGKVKGYGKDFIGSGPSATGKPMVKSYDPKAGPSKEEKAANAATMKGDSKSAPKAAPGKAVPGSPGRGPTGKLRNFKAMNPVKLKKTISDLEAFGKDPEALAAVKAVAKDKGVSWSGGDGPSKPTLKDTAPLDKSNVPSPGAPSAPAGQGVAPSPAPDAPAPDAPAAPKAGSWTQAKVLKLLQDNPDGMFSVTDKGGNSYSAVKLSSGIAQGAGGGWGAVGALNGVKEPAKKGHVWMNQGGKGWKQQPLSALADIKLESDFANEPDPTGPASAPDASGAPVEGFQKNTANKSLKDLPLGTQFETNDGIQYTLHKAVGDPWMIAKPLGGGKAVSFHKMMGPAQLGPMTDGYDPNGGPADLSPAPVAQEPSNDALFAALSGSVDIAQQAKAKGVKPTFPKPSAQPSAPAVPKPGPDPVSAALAAYQASGGNDPKILAALKGL